MKKSILSGLLLLSMLGYGQEKLAKYSSLFFTNSYDISASSKMVFLILKKPCYYIDCSSKDASSKMVSLILKNKEVPEFTEYLNSIKETYTKWTLIAKENKVTELDKTIEYKNLTYSAAFMYGKWNFDFSVNLKARYKIVNEKYLLIIDSDELQSSSNQYIKSEGFRIVFSSIQEIDELISGLDFKLVDEFYNKKKGQEDLFKN